MLYILQNAISCGLVPSLEPPSNPVLGSWYLFDKTKLSRFRKDGIQWRKKKDNRTVREHHEKLKVDGIYAINCTYASSADPDNLNFFRRVYSSLDSSNSIVFGMSCSYLHGANE